MPSLFGQPNDLRAYHPHSGAFRAQHDRMPLSSYFLRLENTLTSRIASCIPIAYEVKRLVQPYSISSPTFPQHAIRDARSLGRRRDAIYMFAKDATSTLRGHPSPLPLECNHEGDVTSPICTVCAEEGVPTSCLELQNRLNIGSPTVGLTTSGEAAEDVTSANCFQNIRRVSYWPSASSSTQRKGILRNLRTKQSSNAGYRRLSLPRRRHLRHNPTLLLSQWLEKETYAEKKGWEGIDNYASAPQTILLRHMYHDGLNPEKGDSNDFKMVLENEEVAALERQGFTNADIESWAWALSGKDSDVRAERYLSLGHPKPLFLLLIILRRPLSRVHTLRALLLDVWDQVHQKVAFVLSREEEQSQPTFFEALRDQPNPDGTKSAKHEFIFTEASFIALLRQLLRQARQLWPPATVSLAQMFEAYYLSLLPGKTSNAPKLDRQRHALLCKRYNQMICALGLPASSNPMRSMTYNWMAQRVILGMAGKFEPRLVLNSRSYRAMIRVLVASKKSEQEVESTTLRRREWPPWTVERSGMDAKKSLEEDFSRVILAGAGMREAGYVEDASDVAMKILGGQEIDGTPTILTRMLIKPQASHSDPAHDMNLNAEVWGARIRATRDVQEAWSAFTAFENEGAKGHISAYLAMFEKLNSEAARTGQRREQEDIIPGDANEVLPPLNDNITAYYQSRLQPPTLDVLYARMIGKGIRPHGPCLVFLIRHARTLGKGLQYLRDSGKDDSIIAYLGGFSKIMPSDIVPKIPHTLYTAFIELLCRCSPRAQMVTSDLDSRNQTLAAANEVTGPTRSEKKTPEPEPVTRWEIRQLRLPIGLQRFEPLQHAINLLHRRRCRRQAWYAVFQTLARQGAVVDRTKVGEPEDDILSWRILRSLWRDYKTAIGELDPQGFRIICHGFEKAVLAMMKGATFDRSDILDAFAQIKDEFRKLGDTSNTKSTAHHLPLLLHHIDAAQLHIYVRVVGLLEDYEELLFILRWMLRNHEALYEHVLQVRNGRRLLRRAIIAVKVFVRGSDYEAEARTLVESVESWGGWPSEDEAEIYVNY